MTSGEEVIRTAAKLAKRSYDIKHVTVQIERQKKRLSIAASTGLNHLQSGHELI